MFVPAPKPKLERRTAPGSEHDAPLQDVTVMRGRPPLRALLLVSTNPGNGLPDPSVKMLAGFSATSCGPNFVRLRVKPMRATLSHRLCVKVSSITAEWEAGTFVMEPLKGFVCN